jgi:hypothetical protein
MTSDDIVFTATYGDEEKTVRLFAPAGSGDGYHVYIDKLYNGTVVKIRGEWVGHLNENSDLITADFEILGDIIDAHLGGYLLPAHPAAN